MFAPGSYIRPTIGGPLEVVLYATTASVETYNGNRYHPTKVVAVTLWHPDLFAALPPEDRPRVWDVVAFVEAREAGRYRFDAATDPLCAADYARDRHPTAVVGIEAAGG